MAARAEGVRRDDRYAADGDVSEYRDLVRQGVTVIATDTPLAVKSVLGAEVAAKLGYARALAPAKVADGGDMAIACFRTLAQFVDHLLGR